MNLILEGSEEPRLLQLLTDAQSSMARLFEFRARHLGLSRPQWRIISGLHGNAGVTQTELSEMTAIARSPLGKIVDQLETRGFLERRSDPEDRRINRLYLTDAVAPMLLPAARLAHELEANVLAEFPEGLSPTQQLSHLVERLHAMVRLELSQSRPPVRESAELVR